jgi:hypothetical protein
MFSIGSDRVGPFRTLWSWQAHTTPIVAITIITIIIDGATRSQTAGPGGISQGIITQKKSGKSTIDTEEIEGPGRTSLNRYQNEKSQSRMANTIVVEGEYDEECECIRISLSCTFGRLCGT